MIIQKDAPTATAVISTRDTCTPSGVSNSVSVGPTVVWLTPDLTTDVVTVVAIGPTRWLDNEVASGTIRVFVTDNNIMVDETNEEVLARA